MKNRILTIVTAGALLSGVSCGPNAQTGTVLGGLLGAGAGAIVGNQSGRPLEGAALGAIPGAVAGGLIGNAKDERERQEYERYRYEQDQRRRYYNDRRYNEDYRY